MKKYHLVAEAFSTIYHRYHRSHHSTYYFIGVICCPGNPIKGVTLGVITYSFREQPDQSIEAILQSILDTGLRATELMGDTAEIYAGKPKNPVKMSELFSLWRTRSEGTLTDDQKKQLESLEAQNTEYRKETSKWRASASPETFEKKIYV